MKALPFPCIRANAEKAIESVSSADSLLASRSSVRVALDNETLLKDGGSAYYLYESTVKGHAPVTGILAICPLDALSFFDVDMTPDAFEAVQDVSQCIVASGLQAIPAPLAYPDQPVMDIILGAVKQGAALFDLFDPAGTRHRIWTVKREDTVEAIKTMLQQVSHAEPADLSPLLAMQNARETFCMQAEAAGTYTGREPFNFAYVALYQKSQLADGIPYLPAGFVMHQVQKL